MTKYLRCIKSVGGRTVGERYKVTAEDDEHYYVSEYERFTKEPDRDGLSYRTWFVLETDEEDDIRQQVAGLTDAVGKLTLKVAELERKLPQSEYVKVISGPVNSAPPSFAKRPTVGRDYVIERAKRDVAELERTSRPAAVRTITGGLAGFYPRGNNSGHIPCDEVTYVINREKRTVVALIRWLDGRTVWARGIAKCAPGDCFNVHIGRAIALRRALGLEVPYDYVSCPQPTEPKPGDIVAGATAGGYYSVDKRFTLTGKRDGDSFKYVECPTDWIYRGDIGRIIDDSRGEDEGAAE